MLIHDLCEMGIMSYICSISIPQFLLQFSIRLDLLTSGISASCSKSDAPLNDASDIDLD